MCDWLRRLFGCRRVCSGREALQRMRADASLVVFTQAVVDTAIRTVVQGRKVKAGLVEHQAQAAARAIVEDLLHALSVTIQRVESDGLTQKGG